MIMSSKQIEVPPLHQNDQPTRLEVSEVLGLPRMSVCYAKLRQGFWWFSRRQIQCRSLRSFGCPKWSGTSTKMPRLDDTGGVLEWNVSALISSSVCTYIYIYIQCICINRWTNEWLIQQTREDKRCVRANACAQTYIFCGIDISNHNPICRQTGCPTCVTPTSCSYSRVYCNWVVFCRIVW